MRAHALNAAGVACARARSGAREGSDNLAQGVAQRSPGSASAHDTRALKGRDRRQAALRRPRFTHAMGVDAPRMCSFSKRCRPYRALSCAAPCLLGLGPRRPARDLELSLLTRPPRCRAPLILAILAK